MNDQKIAPNGAPALIHALVSSDQFRTLHRKTQAFPLAQGPISIRGSHSAETCSWCRLVAADLGLDGDTAGLGALCHDIGQVPLGKPMERVLHRFSGGVFNHPSNGIRVLEDFEIDTGLKVPENVKFTVANHSCDVGSAILSGMAPESTLVVIGDKVNHLTSDVSDAIAAGVIGKSDIPYAVLDSIGASIADWQAVLAADVVGHSNRTRVAMSEDRQACLKQLKAFLIDSVYSWRAMSTAADDLARAANAVLNHLMSPGCEEMCCRQSAVYRVAAMDDTEFLALADSLHPGCVDAVYNQAVVFERRLA